MKIFREKNRKKEGFKDLIIKIETIIQPLRRPLKIIIIFIILFLFGGSIIYYLKSSPYFIVKNINVRGNKTILPEEVIGACKIIPLKTNLLFLNTSLYKSFCETHRWIQKAEIKKELPQSINITIIEEDPIFLLSLDGLFLVNAKGIIFKKVEPLEFFPLPIVSVSEEMEGLFIKNESYFISKIERLISMYNGWEWKENFKIDEIRLEPIEKFNLINYETGLTISINDGNYDLLFNKLKEVLEILNKKGSKAEYISLENIENRGWATIKPASILGKREEININKGVQNE